MTRRFRPTLILTVVSLVLLLGTFVAPQARTPGGPRSFIMVLDGSPVHNEGELLLHMSNWGMFGSWPGSTLPFATAPSGEWPAGSGIEHVFTGGLWVGALDQGVPAVSTAAYQWEFRPTQDVRDVVYRSAEGAEGGTRYGWPGADDDNDGKIDEEFLDGRDNDLDGEIDEDFAAISDQMFSRWYTDNEPSAIQEYPQHNPLNIFVRERSYQWTDDDFDDFVGIDYEITNVGPNALDDVYFGIFLDGDVGNRNTPGYGGDDVAGYVRIPALCTDYGGVSLNYGYVADATSSSTMGVMLLDHVTDQLGDLAPVRVGWTTFAHFNGNASFEDGGDPTNDFERYELMSQRTIERDGTVPRDYRILVSVGPFAELLPESTLTFSIALVCSPEPASIVNPSRAALAYRGQWINRDGDANTGVVGRETRVDGPADGIYIDSCMYPGLQPISVPRGQTVFINNDCGDERLFLQVCAYDDSSKYKTGVDGKEFHVHWVLPTDEILTPVAIQRFGGRPDGSAVRLEWETWADEDVAGFELLRAVGSGALVRLAEAIPADQNEYRDEQVVAGTRYEYQLVMHAASGGTAVSQRIGVTVPSLALALEPGAPNPFQGATTIRFTVPEQARVTLSVFDAAGRRVTTIASGVRTAGTHQVSWDGTDNAGQRVSAGVYFCRLEAGKQTMTRKLLLMK